MIPTITCEEHHEIYAVWHRALAGKGGNVLMHVDAHPDLDAPVVQADWPALDDSAQSVYDFVTQQLHIGDFICPAVFHGMFAAIYWVAPADQVAKPEFGILTVTASDYSATCLTAAVTALRTRPLRMGESLLGRFSDTFTEQLDFRGPVVLDVDLDYFACHATAQPLEFSVEVTADEALKISRDPHHPLRVLHGRRLRLAREGDRSFLVFRGFAPSPPAELPAAMENRIHRLVDLLQRQHATPELITIARSRLSGTTPSEYWQSLEHTLLRVLGHYYPINVMSVIEYLAIV